MQLQNPIIVGYDRNHKEVVRAPLDQIKGMAWGPREDFERGKIIHAANWCASEESHRVCYWSSLK